MTRHLDEGLGRLLAAWVQVVQRRARFVVVLALAVTFAIIPYTAAHLRIDADATHMFAPNLPFQRLLADYDRAFPNLDDRLYVVIDAATPGRAQEAADALAGRLAREAGVFQSIYRPGGGPFFDTHALLYLEPRELEDLADRLADVQPYLAELAADESLRGNVAVLGKALDAVRTGTAIGFDLVAVLDRVRAAVDATLDGRPYEAPWRDVLFGHAAWASKRRQFLDLKPSLDFGALAPGKEAIAAVHRLARELRLDPAHGVRVRVTGSVALAYEEMESAKRGATIAALLSLALVTLILFVALRSLRLVVATVVTLGLGLMWTAAFAALAIGHLNLFSVAFAVLFIGLGVDFGIHMCVHYRELTGRGRTAPDALAESVRTVGSSLTLCAATTATGFYAFWPTGFSGVAELGVICGTGMIISLVANLTALPAMLQLMPPASGTTRHPGDHRLAAWLA
ncbi:MAG: MMPL family transporter, partial [Candidatus Binatia bacterium]